MTVSCSPKTSCMVGLLSREGDQQVPDGAHAHPAGASSVCCGRIGWVLWFPLWWRDALTSSCGVIACMWLRAVSLAPEMPSAGGCCFTQGYSPSSGAACIQPLADTQVQRPGHLTAKQDVVQGHPGWRAPVALLRPRQSRVIVRLLPVPRLLTSFRLRCGSQEHASINPAYSPLSQFPGEPVGLPTT